MYIYCVKSFAHIECYSDCSHRGAIWLNPFATVLFMCVVPSLYSVVFCTLVAWVCFSVIKGRRLLSGVFVITERRDKCRYEVPLSIALLGFGMGTMLTNFHMCGIMLVLRGDLGLKSD